VEFLLAGATGWDRHVNFIDPAHEERDRGLGRNLEREGFSSVREIIASRIGRIEGTLFREFSQGFPRARPPAGEVLGLAYSAGWC
jgi:hypothetical protein